MNRLSIRCRLTLWYGAALAVVLLLFCIATFWSVKRTLVARTDAVLREELREICLEIEISTSEDLFAEAARSRFYHHDAYDFAVRRADGRIVFLSAGLQRADAGILFEAGLSDTVHFAGYETPDDRGLRGAGVRQQSPFGLLEVMSVTALLPLSGELDSLQSIMLLLYPPSLLFALLGGYLLAGRALNPVRDLVVAANAISIDSLDQRVRVVNEHDEIGQMAGTLNALIARLESAVQEIKRFTADASHELRTPIAALRTEAELALSRYRTPAEYVRALHVVVAEATQLSRLADQLLELSRNDAGVPLSRLSPVSLPDALDDVIERYQLMACEAGIGMDVECHLDCTVMADEVRLRQVFANLVENAIKYSNAGGQVSIRTEQHAEQVVVAIEDNGIGIAAEHVPHLFERFYRVDTGRSSATGGTGLGLAIAHAAVRAFDGEIVIHSELHRGTTVAVRLPTTITAAFSKVEFTDAPLASQYA